MRNVALASAVTVTLLNRIEYAVIAVVYFLTEVPLLLGVVAMLRWRKVPTGQRVESYKFMDVPQHKTPEQARANAAASDGVLLTAEEVARAREVLTQG